MLVGMSNWVTPAGFLSYAPSLPMPAHGQAGPAFGVVFYVVGVGVVGVIGVLIVAAMMPSVARHVGMALWAGCRRVVVRDGAAPGAHAP